MKKIDSVGKILIVDDNPSNVKILKERLESYKLEVANSGEDALKIAPVFAPDLILLDVMMPGMNGYEVCRKIRVNSKLKGAKIIMISAKALRSERLQGYDVGADDYIVKPFDGQELLAKVQVYLRLKSTEEFNRSLKKEVREQTGKLREAKEAAEAANRAKDKFISTMTHELRNPLTSVIGCSDLLTMQCDGALTEQQLHYVNLIRQAGNHLSNLVSEVFDVVKIDRNVVELDLSSFSAAGFIDATVDMIRNQLKAKDLNVTVKIDPKLTRMTGDNRRCKQILLNLLSNAVKYTDHGGSIEIHAKKDGDSSVRISVADNGIGIKEEHQQKLFSEFYQVDRRRDEKLGGTGIGLALTRRLVELHGGKIGVKSKNREGSKFWFTLPIVKLDELEEPLSEEVFTDLPRRIAGRRVLVVEDNEANQATIIDMLDSNDIEVTIAGNGREAIELAKYRTPDLVLMDLRMPMMDGFEATEKLRAIPEFLEIPIVALSASADKRTIKRCITAGCNEHLSKPIAYSDLRNILIKYI
jgi:two-component system, sensor histidine kinase